MKRQVGPNGEVIWSGSVRPRDAASDDRAEVYAPQADANGRTRFDLKERGGKAQEAKAGKKTPARSETAPETAAPRAAANSPAEQSRVLAETVVGSLLDRLTAEARRKGGQLSIDDIRGLDGEFKKKTEALQQVFEQSFEEYVKARERAAWEQARQYPFDRIIVKNFSHLFADGPELVNSDDAVSRRILPGFFMALNMMLGPQLMEEYQERCRTIVKRYKQARGDDFSWGEIYDDPEVQAVALEAEVAIAPYFADLEKRADWFIDLINSHMSPYDGDPKAPAARWLMTDVSFFSMMEGLFSHLRDALYSDRGNRMLHERYGQETCSHLYRTFRQMDAAAHEARERAAAG